jgi:hypothetical protein
MPSEVRILHCPPHQSFEAAKTAIMTALIAQSVEHVLGKNGVMGSNPIEGFVTGNMDKD